MESKNCSIIFAYRKKNNDADNTCPKMFNPLVIGELRNILLPKLLWSSQLSTSVSEAWQGDKSTLSCMIGNSSIQKHTKPPDLIGKNMDLDYKQE